VIPAGVLVTVPLPVPVLTTVSVTRFGVAPQAAVTAAVAVTIKKHDTRPE